MFAVQGNNLLPIVKGKKMPPIDLAGLLALISAKQAGQGAPRQRGLLSGLASTLGKWSLQADGAGAGAVHRNLLQSSGGLAISSLDYDGSTLWLVLSNRCVYYLAAGAVLGPCLATRKLQCLQPAQLLLLCKPGPPCAAPQRCISLCRLHQPLVGRANCGPRQHRDPQ